MHFIRNLRKKILICTAVLLVQQVAPSLLPTVEAQALEADVRSLVMSESGISATNVQHRIQFDFQAAHNVGSIRFEYCQNSPLLDDSCTPTTGFNANSAVLAQQVGETGFSIHGSSNANTLILTRPAQLTSPGTVRYRFNNITNGSQSGTSYMRISTHTATDGTGARLDEGGIALSFTDGVSLTTEVPPYLLFCSGIVISGTNCNSVSGSLINMGDFSPTSTVAGTSQMVAATNADFGVSITLIGNTLASGNFPIDAIDPVAASSPGINQFGINLRDNSVPNIGANRSGPGIIAPTADYNIADRYKFAGGDIVARSTNETNITKLTASYIVNIDPDQRPGIYSTTVSYLALATF